MHTIRLLAAVCLAVILAGCLGPRLTSVPGVYDVTVQPVHTLGREINAIDVRPVHDRHPGYLVVFATGDDGWLGTSHAVFRHLAEQGYTILLSMGDQESDLAGGYAEKTFKLPNPVYYLP